MGNTPRPSFIKMMSAYPQGNAQDVFDLIGGKVKANNFANSCAIRLSRSLNYSDHPVEFIPPNLTVSGDDKKWYIYRVTEMVKYLTRKFGSPDIVIENKPYETLLRGQKGIIVFEVDGWSDATGHATLWDGNFCSDQCYFERSKKVILWILK